MSTYKHIDVKVPTRPRRCQNTNKGSGVCIYTELPTLDLKKCNRYPPPLCWGRMAGQRHPSGPMAAFLAVPRGPDRSGLAVRATDGPGGSWSSTYIHIYSTISVTFTSIRARPHERDRRPRGEQPTRSGQGPFGVLSASHAADAVARWFWTPSSVNLTSQRPQRSTSVRPPWGRIRAHTSSPSGAPLGPARPPKGLSRPPQRPSAPGDGLRWSSSPLHLHIQPRRARVVAVSGRLRSLSAAAAEGCVGRAVVRAEWSGEAGSGAGLAGAVPNELGLAGELVPLTFAGHSWPGLVLSTPADSAGRHLLVNCKPTGRDLAKAERLWLGRVGTVGGTCLAEAGGRYTIASSVSKFDADVTVNLVQV